MKNTIITLKDVTVSYDGEQVLTATMYTDQTADGISFFADGTVEMDVVKYDLL